jgi:MoaA/NifB/PqqE/SkfB family radical SAM enzyme
MEALSKHDRKSIKLHFVAHTRNYHEIPQFVLLAGSLGIGMVSVGQYLISTDDHVCHSLLNIRKEYNEIIDAAQDLAAKQRIIFDARRFFSEKKRPNKECISPFDECFIDIEGNLTPCCFSGGYSMGNVYQEGFDNVWFGARYKKLRKSRHLERCRDCAPLIPFDEYNAHFTAHYKQTDEFMNGKLAFQKSAQSRGSA